MDHLKLLKEDEWEKIMEGTAREFQVNIPPFAPSVSWSRGISAQFSSAKIILLARGPQALDLRYCCPSPCPYPVFCHPTTTKVTELQPGMQYAFRVTCRPKAGLARRPVEAAGASPPAVFRTTPAPPSAPTPITLGGKERKALKVSAA